MYVKNVCQKIELYIIIYIKHGILTTFEHKR